MTKRYIALQIGTNRVDDTVKAHLEIGDITGPYYNREEPPIIFNSEEEAVKWARKESIYANWLILPVLNFKDDLIKIRI